MNVNKAVTEFHCTMGVPISSKPCIPSSERVKLRARLITEEYFETMTALIGSVVDDEKTKMEKIIDSSLPVTNIIELADGLCDLDYVVEGTRLEFGINGEEILIEVHRTNMLKTTGLVREDGKRLKPEGWKPPDIAGILIKQGYNRV